jgi:hypothetical protein
MSNTITDALFASLSEASIEASHADFVTISLSVPVSTQSLVQAFAQGFKRPTLTLLTDSLSTLLADLLLSSKDNIPLVLDEVGKGYEAGAALSILRDRGAISVGNDARWKRALSEVESQIVADKATCSGDGAKTK